MFAANAVASRLVQGIDRSAADRPAVAGRPSISSALSWSSATPIASGHIRPRHTIAALLNGKDTVSSRFPTRERHRRVALEIDFHRIGLASTVARGNGPCDGRATR